MTAEVPVTADRIDKPKLSILVNEKITSLYGWNVGRLEGEVPERNYGINWPKGTEQYFKEAWAYKQGGVGGLSAFDHLIHMIKLDLPKFWFTSNGYINSNALRVIYAFAMRDDLCVIGAASTGKTFPLAACVIQDWKAAPDETLSFVCTTTLSASQDRIWGAIISQWKVSRYKIGTYIAHKDVITWGKFSESAADRDFNSAIKALAIPRGEEGKKAIDTLRGRKQTYVTLVYDELPEMDLYVLDGAINLESNERLKVVGIGNPANHMDAHGQMACPDHPLGFASVNKNTPEWKTRTGWAIFLNGEWSPNFEAGPDEPIPFPKLTNRKTLAKMLKRCHGNRESYEYYRNAIGFWPDSTTIQTVLTEEMIKNSGCCKTPLWRPGKRKRICGFDAGFTSGGDKCVAQVGELGYDEKGKHLVYWVEEKVFMAPSSGVFELQMAKMVVDYCIEMGVEPHCFGMDISGDGGKMMAAIIRYWLTKDRQNGANIVPLSSMGKPSERPVSSVDMRKCIEAFDRKVTEYWMMVREAVLCSVVRNFPLVNENKVHDISLQLCTRTYEEKGKKLSIETKPKMKERTKGQSPDNADGFCYMIEMARIHGLSFVSDDDRDRARERQSRRESWSAQQTQGEYQSDSWGEPDEDAA